MDVDTTKMLKWLEQTPTLTEVTISECSFHGGFDGDSDLVQSVCDKLKNTKIVGLNWRECHESDRSKGFITFLICCLAPTLRWLKLRQTLDASLDFPQLEYLDYQLFERLGGFQRLPILKRLRVNAVEALAYLAVSVPVNDLARILKVKSILVPFPLLAAEGDGYFGAEKPT